MSNQNQYISNFQILPVTLTPVLDTAAYASSDVLFVPTIVPLLASSQDYRRVRVEIMDITIIDRSNDKGLFDLVFCTTNPSTFGAANAACAITSAEAAASVRKVVSVTAYTELTAATNAIAQPDFPSFIIEVPSGATGFFLGAISRDTKTYAANDLVITLGMRFHNMQQA